MKQGQLNQVFIYIVALLMIGAVALIGVRSIGGILSDKCTVDYISFRSTLATLAQENNNYGAVNPAKLDAPCEYTTLCLINSSLPELTELNTDPSLNGEQYAVFQDNVRQGVKENVYLIDSDGFIEPVGYVKQVETQEAITCINSTRGSFYIIMEGKGRTTLVQPRYEH